MPPEQVSDLKRFCLKVAAALAVVLFLQSYAVVYSAAVTNAAVKANAKAVSKVEGRIGHLEKFHWAKVP